jgi:hypothetical protein
VDAFRQSTANHSTHSLLFQWQGCRADFSWRGIKKRDVLSGYRRAED